MNGYSINNLHLVGAKYRNLYRSSSILLILGVAFNLFHDKKLTVFNYIVISMAILLLVQLPSKSYLLSTILACSFTHIFSEDPC